MRDWYWSKGSSPARAFRSAADARSSLLRGIAMMPKPAKM